MGKKRAEKKIQKLEERLKRYKKKLIQDAQDIESAIRDKNEGELWFFLVTKINT